MFQLQKQSTALYFPLTAFKIIGNLWLSQVLLVLCRNSSMAERPQRSSGTPAGWW